MDAFFRALQQPEYIHTLINPLPIYGVALGIIALLAAMLLRKRAAQIPALIIVFIAALSAWPVAHFGDEGYERVLSMADEDGATWLAVHAHRADTLVWCFYALAAVSAVALVAPGQFPKAERPLLILTLLLAIVSLAAGGYIAYAGGRIRHREFRMGPPPPKPAETEH